MRPSRRILLAVLCIHALAISTLATVRAQAPIKHVAVISIAPLERMMPEMSYLLSAFSMAEVTGVMEMVTTFYSKGLDRTKPIAVTVSYDGPEPSFQICVPTTDYKQWFQTLASMGIEPTELAEGLYELAAGGQVMIVRIANNWMYFGASAESLAEVPDDPIELLGDLPQRYSIGVRLDLLQIPAEMRQVAIDQIQSGFERGLAQQLDQQLEQQLERARQAGQEQLQQLQQMQALIQETQQMVFGMLIDPAERTLLVDAAIQFLQGSQLANQMDSQTGLRSQLTNLKLPHSSLDVRVTATLPTEAERILAKQELRAALEQFQSSLPGNASTQNPLSDTELTEEQVTLVRKFVERFIAVAERSIDEGVLDGAMSWSLQSETLTALLGLRVADGQEVAQAVQSFVKELPQPEGQQVQFYYGKHKEFDLHRVQLAVPADDPAASRLLGNRLTLHVATAPNMVLLSVDASGDSPLLSAIDRYVATPPSEVPPLTGSLRLAELMRFAQNLQANAMPEPLIAAFDTLAEDDRVQFSSKILPRGVVTRFMIDEGVLRAFGSAVKSNSIALPAF
ncbi:MAG: hypothetical protein KF752_14085 [Pirellulaceae bacterium]|nr:hypothetical protein [Pirellulaceae bacterium]